LTAILSLGFGFVFLDRNAFAYLAPFVAPELKLTNTQIGLLSAALASTWAIAGVVVARFSDSTGRRKIILLCAFIVFSICSAISGLARSFAVLLAARLLMGLSEGPILPVSQSLLALESSADRRGLNMGVMQNFGSNLIGNFVAPLLLVAVANTYNWRVAFFIAAVPGLITAGLIAKWVRDPIRHPTVSSRLIGANADAIRPAWSVGMFGHANMWLCILLSSFMVAWMVLGWAFLPLFFVRVRHFSAPDMSILMSVLGMSAAVCAICVPWLSDRLGRKPIMIGFCLVGVLTPSVALWYTGPFPVLAALMFAGWSASGVFPLFMATIPAETMPPAFIGTSLAIVMGAGEIAGGVIAPTAAGRAADAYGLQAPVLVELACAVVATVFALFLRETAPVKRGASGAVMRNESGRPSARTADL
jgi:MFS family permease